MGTSYSPGVTSASVGAPAVTMPPPVGPSTIVTSFQSGHGWVQFGSGTYNVNDTTAGNFIVGSQSLRMTTNGAGAITQVRRTGISPALDMTGKMFALTLRVLDNTHVSSIFVQAGDTSLANRFNISVQGNASGDDEYIESNKWVRLVVPWRPSTTTGTPNRAAITDLQVYVFDNNTGNTVTVQLQQVEIVPEPSTAWPNGVLSFDFDDCYSSQYTAAQKLSQYRFPGTLYTICDVVGTAGFLTEAQMKEMERVHGWSIAAHAYTKVNHDARLTSLSSTALAEDMRRSREWLASRGFRALDFIAYPGGKFNPTVLDETRRQFGLGRTVKSRQHETWPPSDAYKVRALSIQSTTTVSELQAEIDAAYSNKTWLILIFHRLVSSAGTGNDWLQSDFNTIVDYAATKGIPVRNVEQVITKR